MSEQEQVLAENAFASSKDVLTVFEVDDNKHQGLKLWALSKTGTWFPIFEIDFSQYEASYRSPLLLRFGYAHQEMLSAQSPDGICRRQLLTVNQHKRVSAGSYPLLARRDGVFVAGCAFPIIRSTAACISFSEPPPKLSSFSIKSASRRSIK
jgi:hypothetical protein